MIIDSPLQSSGIKLTTQSVKSLLTTAVNYCNKHSDILCESPLVRSSELMEAACKVYPDSCHTLFSDEMASAFDEFYARRMSHVESSDCDRETLSENASLANLLLVDWRRSLFDGVCTPMTSGFIDDNCMPGWDSWIALVTLDDIAGEHGLLCWIPKKLVEGVNDALTLDAAECMSWLRWNEDKLELVGWGQRLGD